MGQSLDCATQAQHCCRRPNAAEDCCKRGQTGDKGDLLVPWGPANTTLFMNNENEEAPQKRAEGTSSELRRSKAQVEEMPRSRPWPPCATSSADAASASNANVAPAAVATRSREAASAAPRTAAATPSSSSAGPGRSLPRRREIAVYVTMSAAAPSLGVDVEHEEELETLRIAQIKAGPVQRWNDAHDEFMRVRPGDFLLSANGVSGAEGAVAREIRRAARESAPLHLQVQRAGEIEIRVEKENVETGLGLDVDVENLRVNMLKEGPILDYNQRLRAELMQTLDDGEEIEDMEFAVKPGDYIVEINGARGIDAVLDCVKAAKVLNIVLRRPPYV